ncbi:hypothetical protein LAZ67_X002480 [Cordylochernes scorpioides]|uniref:Reverse transcriptase domain-containing protein n=1 Tax=Cordylochernes scorpioides TaxID=51811 RepID=A0ABY6LVK4_9ARAC|nr:hypothetical protein LAZ67_X002480 [Cordylochernes scorpioides]
MTEILTVYRVEYGKTYSENFKSLSRIFFELFANCVANLPFRSQAAPLAVKMGAISADLIIPSSPLCLDHDSLSSLRTLKGLQGNTRLHAFDQLWILALSHRLHALSLPPSLLNMYAYGSFLVNRSTTLTYRGHSRSVSPSRGCAQGSKSGPILWNIFFDPILSPSFQQGVHIQAFADDIQLVITGHPDTLPSTAQTSLDLINTWYLDHKLKLSSSKYFVLQIFCLNPSLHINFIPIPCLE